MNLDKKVVVVSGGAGLLGRTFCQKIATDGGIPVVADINIKQAQETAKSIKNATAIDMDITSEKSLLGGIEKLISQFGKIDAFVNSAYPRGTGYGDDLLSVKYENFCETLNLNLGGYFLASKVYAKFFMEQGHGNIINISSIYGVTAPKFEVYSGTKMTMPVEYAAIKSALIHLTKYFAVYFKNKNIRVNSISPGGILDNQPEPFLKSYREECTSIGMLSPIDIAGTLSFLLSDESKAINGQNFIVDDGFTL